MASITLKNLPEELLRGLREAAEADRRSLTQEVIHLLEAALQARDKRPPMLSDLEAQVAAWRALAGRWESHLDRAAEAEAVMERRTPGREEVEPSPRRFSLGELLEAVRPDNLHAAVDTGGAAGREAW